ncbi:MAG: 50S ribosomal protein L13 [Chloroflexota bacterium]
MKTYTPSMIDFPRHWYVADAEGQVLGRLATEVARILMGKHKPTWTSNLDTGDYVIIVNAAKVRVTGDKLNQKMYQRHSGYPGGFKERPLSEMMSRFPERVVEEAVRGMLPHTRLGAAMLKKLKVYAGPNHKQAAQQPTVLTVVGKHGQPTGPFAAVPPVASV